ncbi:hypothetical protein [Klebsiella phage pKV-BS375-3.1]|nr:hypothetical protein [Klebsiella phage pKV-BS375-3.1]
MLKSGDVSCAYVGTRHVTDDGCYLPWLLATQITAIFCGRFHRFPLPTTLFVQLPVFSPPSHIKMLRRILTSPSC